MNQKLIVTMTILLVLSLLITVIPLFISKTEAQVTSTPTQFIEYSSAVASATVPVPNIGNITSINLSPTHQDKSSTIDNYDVLGFTIASNLTSKTLMAYITTNKNESDIAWRKALKNGTSTYTNINGTETINNILILNPNELRVQRNGSSLSLDFNPQTTINLTLPATDFPRGNFSATWTIPAFHVDWVGVRNLTLYNTTTTNNPSGWIEYRAGAFYPANFTFSAPSWNNYTISGTTNFLSEFSVHRGYAPIGVTVPANATKTVDFQNGYGTFTVDIPKTGGITRMVISVYHREQGTTGFPVDVMGVTLSATGFNGTALATFSTNQNNDALIWVRTLYNGTSRYTQVGNNITINNIFIINASELVVRRNGTRLTADFNPATSKNITLPTDFPRTNFSATFTMPRFHLDIDANGTRVVIGNGTNNFNSSGWVQNSYFLSTPSNSTITIPSMNVTASSSNSSLLPYLASFSTGPFNPLVIPEFSGSMEFVTIAVLLTATVAILLRRPHSSKLKRTLNH